MQPMILDGSFADDIGTESVTWLIADSDRPGWPGRYEVTARIRGVRVCGPDFTSLEVQMPTTGVPVNAAGEIDHCDITVSVPARIIGTMEPRHDLVLTFHLGSGRYEPVVDAVLSAGASTVRTSQEERLEEVLGALVRQLEGAEWECCLTCGLSDYDPGGHGNMGMRCHRDARSEYLSSRGKWEYWGVPVTEEVPEFYRCDLWERRHAGTGYRG